MIRHRNFKELLAKMLPERRARVKAEADDLHREFVLSLFRQQVGFTQTDVVERLGVSLKTYAKCERGNNMRIRTLQKIASALGVELSLNIKVHGDDVKVNLAG